MADQKISELTALTGANVADDDAIAIVDTSATETKKIVFSELKNALDTATGFVRITGDTMTGALDVQSTITSDGLTVDGLAKIQGTATGLVINETDTTDLNTYFNANSGDFNLMTTNDAFTSFTTRLNVDHSTGDISFYEDTGSTAKLTWSASTESLRFDSATLQAINGTDPFLSGNAYWDGSNWKYATSTDATNYYQTGRQHIWRSAASGTAGNNITWSQSMQIDASGNLVVGAASQDAASSITLQHDGDIRGVLASGAGGESLLCAISGVSNGYQISVDTSNNQTYKWYNGGTPSMTLDASGNLLLGDTSATFNDTAKTVIRPSSDNWTIKPNVVHSFNRTSGNGDILEFYQGSSNKVGSISVTSSATAYNTSSDYRLKTDAQPMTGATDRIKQLNPVNFEWIADGTRVDGFLAHEAQAVVPECVTGTHNEVDADGNAVMQGIDQAKLVPLLVKTIQELEARITALENA